MQLPHSVGGSHFPRGTQALGPSSNFSHTSGLQDTAEPGSLSGSNTHSFLQLKRTADKPSLAKKIPVHRQQGPPGAMWPLVHSGSEQPGSGILDCTTWSSASQLAPTLHPGSGCPQQYSDPCSTSLKHAPEEALVATPLFPGGSQQQADNLQRIHGSS